jgi:hypothetical protein
LALIEVDVGKEHPEIRFSEEYAVGDQLYCYGFSIKNPGGESLLGTVEGEARRGPSRNQVLIKFSQAQVVPGFSGAPLFSVSTGAVVGIIRATRDADSALGGLAIPATTILSEFPFLNVNKLDEPELQGAEADAAALSLHPEALVSAAGVNDVPADIDSLGFEPYVSAVTAFLTDPATHPPLTLSIEGSWGAGKSSFMVQLERKLAERGRRTVRFNAWRHDKDESLWAAFAITFIRELAAKMNPLKRALLHSKLLVRRFDWQRGWLGVAQFALLASIFALVTFQLLSQVKQHGFTSLVNAVLPSLETANKPNEFSPDKASLAPFLISLGGVVSYVVLAILTARNLKDLLGSPFEIKLSRFVRDPNYDGHVGFVETFHRDFSDIVALYTGGQPVYVFIDDLDRCEIPKSADLIQALNVMLSSESAPLFFILGIDRQMIAASIAAKYEKILPYLAQRSAVEANGASMPEVGITYGYNFVEKFIQLPFQLPLPSDLDVARLVVDVELNVSGSKSHASDGLRALDSHKPGIELADSKEAADFHQLRRETMGRLITMAAPLFDYNPRRIKLFANAFRLTLYIAQIKGMFVEPEPESPFSQLTVFQLGKVVGIRLRWPRLYSDIAADVNLLSNLQLLALGDFPNPSGSMKYWGGEPQLMRLLQFGIPINKGQGRPESPVRERLYSLERLDVQMLVRISPVTRDTLQ